MRLGDTATLPDLLDKLQRVYGILDDKQTLMTRFYNSEQMEGEDVVSWAFRAESLIEACKEKGLVSASTEDEMLRTKFWTGLLEPMRDKSGHKFDADTSYNELFTEIRMLESKQTRKTTSFPVQQSNSDSKLEGMMAKITKRLDGIDERLEKAEQKNEREPVYQRRNTNYNGYRGRQRVQSYKRGSWNRPETTRPPRNNTPRQHQETTYTEDYDQGASSRQDYRKRSQEEEVICHQCHQVGHLKYGCRVRLDHRNLNEKESTSEGRW